MRSVRVLLGALALLASASACGVASAKEATSTTVTGAWIQVSPGSVTAGSSVVLRANCLDNTTSATVSSAAFGAVTLAAQRSTLTGQVTVPSRTRSGTYDVKLTCRSGATATTTLSVLGAGTAPATVGPHTGGGFLARGMDTNTAATLWILAGSTTLAGAVGMSMLSARRRRRAAASRSTDGRP